MATYQDFVSEFRAKQAERGIAPMGSLFIDGKEFIGESIGIVTNSAVGHPLQVEVTIAKFGMVPIRCKTVNEMVGLAKHIAEWRGAGRKNGENLSVSTWKQS